MPSSSSFPVWPLTFVFLLAKLTSFVDFFFFFFFFFEFLSSATTDGSAGSSKPTTTSPGGFGWSGSRAEVGMNSSRMPRSLKRVSLTTAWTTKTRLVISRRLNSA